MCASPHSFAGAIERLTLREPSFQSVIDVGAAVGDWSSTLAIKFPGREYLLIEANAVHASALESICQKNHRWTYVLKACGPECGSIYFDRRDPFGGQARRLPDSEANQDLPMTTIDYEIAAHNMRPPFLIKLDTHGFEIPILKGAANALQQTEVLVVEAYNFVIGTEAIRFWALCEWLEERGFLPIDMFDVMYRPYDRALWQMDIVFMRSSRPEFQIGRYR
jgi:FkbM family methyltransferase